MSILITFCHAYALAFMSSISSLINVWPLFRNDMSSGVTSDRANAFRLTKTAMEWWGSYLNNTASWSTDLFTNAIQTWSDDTATCQGPDRHLEHNPWKRASSRSSMSPCTCRSKTGLNRWLVCPDIHRHSVKPPTLSRSSVLCRCVVRHLQGVEKQYSS
jgi:hypothetical protein